jgi:hypothetical protein
VGIHARRRWMFTTAPCRWAGPMELILTAGSTMRKKHCGSALSLMSLNPTTSWKRQSRSLRHRLERPARRTSRQATILRGGVALNDNIAFEIDTFSYLCKSEDWTRGQRAFLHGEKPHFPRPLRMHMSQASSRRYPGLVARP